MIGRKALGKKTALPQPVRDVYVWLNRNIGRVDPRPRVLPNFYVVGTQRGGSTSMFIYLLAHEMVHGPRRAKGVHYFDTNFDETLDWYKGNFPLQSTIDAQRAEHGAEPAIGEGAPYYLFHPTIPQRIHDVTSGARIIAVLREPLGRAISHHNHEVVRGNETLSLLEALDAEEERLEGEEQRIIDDPTYISKPRTSFTRTSRVVSTRNRCSATSTSSDATRCSFLIRPSCNQNQRRRFARRPTSWACHRLSVVRTRNTTSGAMTASIRPSERNMARDLRSQTPSCERSSNPAP